MNHGPSEYMLSARGIPIRTVARRCTCALRCWSRCRFGRSACGQKRSDGARGASATSGTPAGRNAARADNSAKFGLASPIESRPALISFMDATSSTVPFSQVAMIKRCSPSCSGTLVGARAAARESASRATSCWSTPATSVSDTDAAPPVRTSMNVRKHLFLQK